jgi:hypothetical protein
MVGRALTGLAGLGTLALGAAFLAAAAFLVVGSATFLGAVDFFGAGFVVDLVCCEC